MVNMNVELAEICGIHAGDGYMRIRERNKGEVDISGSLEEKEYYDFHVIPMFNRIFGLDIRGRFFSRGTYGFVCYKKEVRSTLNELGFVSGNKSRIVEVPNIILNNSDEKILCAFLRGLFDTDGNLFFRKSYTGKDNFKINNNHYPIISLNTNSKALAEGIIKILHRLDFLFYYYVRESRKLNQGREHVIRISGITGLDKWMSLVGIRNPVKFSRYLVWKKLGFCPPNTSLKQREDLLKSNSNSNYMGL